MPSKKTGYILGAVAGASVAATCTAEARPGAGEGAGIAAVVRASSDAIGAGGSIAALAVTGFGAMTGLAGADTGAAWIGAAGAAGPPRSRRG